MMKRPACQKYLKIAKGRRLPRIPAALATLAAVCCLPLNTVLAGSISGTVSYDGIQKGEIIVQVWRPIPGNRALRMDGDGDSVSIEDVDLSGSEITVQYWFNGASYQSAVRQQAGGYLVAGWNRMHILSQDNGTNGISAGSDITDGQWHQLVMTWKQATAGGFSSYLDGEPVAQRDSVDAPIPAHGAPLYFGAFNGVGEFSSGFLDEIAIWNRALSAEEVQDNYLAAFSGTEPGLVGYWNFDDGAATDLTGGGWDGVFNGDASAEPVDIPGVGSGLFASTLPDPGVYTVDGVPGGTGYRVFAFLDANGNGAADRSEPSGDHGGGLVDLDVDGELSGVDVTLTEAPSVTSPPSDIEAALGAEIVFHVEVSGTSPFTFQWFKDNKELSDGDGVAGATSDRLVLDSFSREDEGIYDVIISNDRGEIRSDGARLSEAVPGFSIAGTVAFDDPAGNPANKALVLDGDGDYAMVPALRDLSGAEITVQYWFKGGNIQSAVRQQGGAGWVVAGWNGLHILFNDGGVDGLPAGENVTDGAWHHLALTWRQNATNGFATYLDGELVARRDSSNTPIPNLDADLFLGAFNGAGEFTEGMLDEVTIWNRALSASEIRAGFREQVQGDEEGLTAYWNFDGGDVADGTGNGFDGTLFGDAAIVDAPERGGSGDLIVQASQQKFGNRILCVDGDADYVVIDSLADMSGSEISIQYWFRGDSFQSAVRQQSGGYIVAGWNGQHILSNDGATNGISAGENVTDGNWHHLVMTWRQNAINGFSSYLDGNLVTSRDSADNPVPLNNTALYFGAFNGTGEFATGCLDEIAVWNRALSGAEVRANWNGILTGEEEGLVGVWNFDDGTAGDLSPNEHNGDLVGDTVILPETIASLGGRVFSGVFDGPGDYLLTGVPSGPGYVVTAYLDNNGNRRQDKDEPAGVYEGNPFDLDGDLSGIAINLLAPAAIIVSPESVSLRSGETAVFTAQVAGDEPLTIEWLKAGIPLVDGDNIAGASTTELTIMDTQAPDLGSYSIRASNPATEDVSEPVMLNVTDVVPVPNLLVHWTFDETAGTVVSDASGNGVHVPVVTIDSGAFERGQDPLAAGKSIRLDNAGGAGLAFAELSAENEFFPPLERFSASLWVRQDRGSEGVSSLFSKGLQGGDPFALGTASGSLLWFAGGIQQLEASNALEPETVYHVAVTVESSPESPKVVLYVDGQEIARDETQTLYDDTDPSVLQVGALGSSFGFGGTIDDFQLYDRELSADEIAFLFANPGVPVGMAPDIDTDGDGATDASEAVAGTNPIDAGSVLRFEDAVRDDNGFTLTWQSVPEKTYEVEFSESAGGEWKPVESVASQGGMTSYTDTDADRLSKPQGHYRAAVHQIERD